MTLPHSLQRALLPFACLILLGACAGGTQITRVQDLSESADAPYKKILVIALFASYDVRMYLEKETVKQLAASGIDAVASTTMMNSNVPATRATFVAMVDKIGADAVLVSQPVSLDTDVTVKNRRPQATYNFRPTYYYNVWNVELTEYIEPASVALGHSVVLTTQVYSVTSQGAVWGIESKFRVAQKVDQLWDHSIFPQQAMSIVTQLLRDRLIVPVTS